MPAPGKDVLQPSQRAEERQNPEQSLSGKVGSWLKRHYLALINTALAIYIILPLMAPVLMKTGQTSAADVIYRMYKPLCHQLAYRSFFLLESRRCSPVKLLELKG